ncbi:MAG: hypothetical protein N2246_06760 [Candidatus Sumerlaeia bacterium]|nr:hypothetical protein [Candidatus Sumerlaeia bacterium]
MNERRDAFGEYVYYLWKKRYIIILAGIGFALITYVVFSIKGLFYEKYEVNAALLINQPPPIQGLEYEDFQTPAISFERLLLSDELINKVLDEFARKYNRRIKLEFFKKRFETKTEVAEDTSVRRRYSPVIQLRAYGNTPEEAKFIMNTWINLAIKHYGDLPAQGAKFFLDYYLTNLNQTQQLLKEKEAEYVKVKWELHSKMKELIDLENQLAPAEIPLDIKRRISELGIARTAQNVDVSIQQRENVPLPGLIAQLSNLDIEIARLSGALKTLTESQQSQAKTPQQEESILNTRMELSAAQEQRKALEAQISQISEKITQIQKVVGGLELRYEELGREIQDLQDKFALFSRLKNQLESYAGIVNYQGEYPPDHRSELRVITSAIKPELRVFPKRGFFTLLALILGSILAILALVINKYLNDIALRESRKAG